METVTLSKQEIDRLSVIERLARRELKQVDAARLLGRSTRQVRRLLRRYQAQGVGGLASRHRGRPANNQLQAKIRRQIPQLIAKHYVDFGPTLAAEKLAERHQIQVSVETVRQLMIEHGLWQPNRAADRAIHPLRQPRPCRGEMIQVDGSLHDWFEDRGPQCCLIVFIDDATSEVMAAQFWHRESTEAYMTVLRDYLSRFGRPVSLYSDRHSIFRSNTVEPRDGKPFTQFGRVLETLHIEALHASSPQAKGRVERANRTLQDRLVKELRLEGISDMATANAFLPRFLIGYNRRFAKPAQLDVDVHREVLHPQSDLDLIFCRQHQRHVSNNLTFQYKNTLYQLRPTAKRHKLRQCKVVVCERFNGEVVVLCNAERIPHEVIERRRPLPAVVDEKQLNDRVKAAGARQRQAPPNIPRPDHPWRSFNIKSEYQKYLAAREAE